MPKFFVKNDQIKNNNIEIVGEDINHIINVLRMRKDEELQICNQETGENYMAKIIEATPKIIKCKIENEIKETTEPNVKITLFQGIPKFEKMELIIQKNTEVGVKQIVPVMMERTVVKLDEKAMPKKIDRWQKIALIAAKQSMRDIIPHVENVIKLDQIDVNQFDLVLAAYENEQNNLLKNELKKIENKNCNIGILIGPEGGISPKEIEKLKEKNAKFISLGKRILRTETAGLIMAGNIIYELEE